MIKECKIHGITNFGYRENKTRTRCKQCAIEAVNKRRQKIKKMSIEYKGGCCSICGYNKSTWALDFHHLDPLIKEFNIGTKGYSTKWEIVKKELDKCILVCKNCHFEIHEELTVRM